MSVFSKTQKCTKCGKPIKQKLIDRKPVPPTLCFECNAKIERKRRGNPDWPHKQPKGQVHNV